MGFCRSAVCVLILLTYLHHAVFEEAPAKKTVKVFLNNSALLPCFGISCIDTVLWVRNSSSVVAQCDVSSCHWTEGYQMSHSDYLKGNFSLNITAVNPNNTGSYSCRCEHTIQEVLLQIIMVEADEKTVRVFINNSALLPCFGISCIDTVLWVRNSSSVVAQCNASSCNSTEGFQMSYSDYLKGNFSLNITAVTPNNSGSYSCRCEHTSIQEVLLQIINTTTVKVEFDGTAVLPCSVNCSGLAKWTTQTDLLAECDQTFCRSVKEGYQMIYNQSLQGDFSLIITEADFSKRGYYNCNCDDTHLCHDRLQINPLKTQVQIKPGESLLLELDVLDPVEVIYNKTGAANQTSHQICTVDERSSQVVTCDERSSTVHIGRPQHTLRTFLELTGLKESDSGVYTIRDIKNKENIHIYNVTIQDHHSHGDNGVWVPTWRFWLVVGLLIVLTVVVFVLVAVIVCMCKNNKRLDKEKLELPCLCGASEEGSQEDTEQEPLASTDHLDNRDSPPTAN